MILLTLLLIINAFSALYNVSYQSMGMALINMAICTCIIILMHLKNDDDGPEGDK